MFDLWVGGEGPSEVPQWAYTHLVTVLNVDTATMMDLKCVQQRDYVGGVLVNLIRIFDLKVEGLVNIEDFSSLDRHPDLILFEGHREEASERVAIVSRRLPAADIYGTKKG